MANVEHSSLTGTNLHELKGVATAAAGTVATAVAGASVWAKLTAANLTTTGNSFGAQLFHAQDQKSNNTNGGTFTSGSWQVRTLNQLLTNEITGASLASNQITLPAGTYRFEAEACGETCDRHKLKLRNVSDGSDPIIGFSENTSSGTFSYARAKVSGTILIAGTKVFELQHRCSNTRTNTGFGVPSNFGVNEVYADVKFWKIL